MRTRLCKYVVLHNQPKKEGFQQDALHSRSLSRKLLIPYTLQFWMRHKRLKCGKVHKQGT